MLVVGADVDILIKLSEVIIFGETVGKVKVLAVCFEVGTVFSVVLILSIVDGIVCGTTDVMLVVIDFKAVVVVSLLVVDWVWVVVAVYGAIVVLSFLLQNGSVSIGRQSELIMLKPSPFGQVCSVFVS